MMTRRQALKTTALAAAACATAAAPTAKAQSNVYSINGKADGQFVLPQLPYAFDALEPHIDAQDDGDPSRQAPRGLCRRT